MKALPVFAALAAVALAPLAATAAEQRCLQIHAESETGGRCLASEPLNSRDAVSGQAWDDTASNDRFQAGTIMFSDAADPHANTAPANMVGPNYAERARGLRAFRMEYGGANMLFMSGIGASPGVKRLNKRWYVRVDRDWVGVSGNAPPCTVDRSKIMDASISPGAAEFQAEEETAPRNPCAGPGEYQHMILSTRFGDRMGTRPISNGFNWNLCRKDAQGNNGWCRFEVSLSGHIDGTAAGDACAEIRMYSLDTGISGTSGLACTRNDRGRFQDVHLNMFHQNGWVGTGGFELSHVMLASWTTDRGQWIGPAGEVERGGPPVASQAPEPQPVPQPQTPSEPPPSS